LTSNILFALLLQAAGAEEATDVLETAEEVTPDVLEQSGILQMVTNAGPVAQVVFVVLLVLSVMTWAIAFSKYRMISHSGRNNLRFLRAFRRASQLVELSAAGENYRPSSLVSVFEFGYKEVARQVNKYGKLRYGAALERSLQLAAGEEMARLQSQLGWLATTASAAPFIGLLGTVWGILGAFRGLGEAGGATLRAVAPGIAEALIATAFGLFAAIPALMFYNYFSNRIREIGARLDNFNIEFFSLAERNYGEQDGVLDTK
jgi:biopolymer transport protein TolQ